MEEIMLTVVMSVYNQERLLAETIESVLAQTHKNFEFMIWDDGSKDNSVNIIREYAEKDKRIIPLFHKNASRATAVNTMIGMAKTNLCALLDHDDEMMPNRLETQLAFHINHTDVNATSCHCYFINDKGVILGKQRHPALRTVAEGKKALANNDILHCAITGLMVEKEAYLKIGGLRSQFGPCDDVDFTNRFIEAGYGLVIIQEILMRYRIHPNSYTETRPMYVFDSIGYVGHCNTLRRAGKPEITFAEFMALRKQDSWWVSINRKRYNYAQIYFRRAGYKMMSKNYFGFVWSAAVAFLCSPIYVYRKILVLSKR